MARLSDRFDDLWPRLARAIGVLLGVGEWVIANAIDRPADPAIIGLATALALLPTALGKRDGNS
ncbi:hypothetical protein [Miltoncostaea marina]|uniref:hypothetical protein n=1 Tax=Miltoncostaea marina TaxID=2843215 RepID=UPI001C3E2455|nr:hypothetical protein [Miltoncostaea marina]